MPIACIGILQNLIRNKGEIMQRYRNKLLILGIVGVSLICIINGPQVTTTLEKVILGTLLGDIPAPPTFGMRYTGFNSGWVLSYDTDLTLEALREYYLEELLKQHWEIEHYSEHNQECILAKRNSVIRVIEMRPAPGYRSRIQVRFDELDCNFETSP